MSDSIEVHFDEKRGYLELACEPNAFATYRELARNQLGDFPDISLEKVVEISIVDTSAIVARRAEPRRRIGRLSLGLVIALILFLAAVGACTIVARILH